MRKIIKQREPNSLTNHRCQSNSDYDNYPDKDELRDCLCREQRDLCAYCMQRISSAWNQMKIEHWQCQDNYPDKQLDYSNILAVYMGGEGRRKAKQTCDTRKGKDNLKYNPADSNINIEELIHYKGDGIVSSNDVEFERQINTVLNLNYQLLIEGRIAYLTAFLQFLQKKNNSKPWSKTKVERLIAKNYDNN